MAVIHLETNTANDMLTALVAKLDTGAGNCVIDFYTGSMPATPATAVTTQTKLGTCTCSDPVGSVASSALTFGTITQDASADATGTVAWARISNPAGTAIIDCDVTGLAGTGALKINSTSIVAGGPIAISSLIIRLP